VGRLSKVNVGIRVSVRITVTSVSVIWWGQDFLTWLYVGFPTCSHSLVIITKPKN